MGTRNICYLRIFLVLKGSRRDTSSACVMGASVLKLGLGAAAGRAPGDGPHAPRPGASWPGLPARPAARAPPGGWRGGRRRTRHPGAQAGLHSPGPGSQLPVKSQLSVPTSRSLAVLPPVTPLHLAHSRRSSQTHGFLNPMGFRVPAPLHPTSWRLLSQNEDSPPGLTRQPLVEAGFGVPPHPKASLLFPIPEHQVLSQVPCPVFLRAESTFGVSLPVGQGGQVRRGGDRRIRAVSLCASDVCRVLGV